MSRSGPAAWRLNTPLRSWQIEALHAWEQAGQRGIVSVVTGAGKTVFAEACILAFLRRYTEGRALIIVPTMALMDQWYVSLREDLGLRTEEISTYSGEGIAERPGRANLAILNTARNVAPSLAVGTDALLIVDEVHHAGSRVNSLALRGSWRATLGMSATPEREHDRGLEDRLIPVLGNIVYTYDYGRAAADGVIARFELVNVEVALLPKEREVYDRLSTKVGYLLRLLKAGRDVEGPLKRVLQRRAAVASAAALRIPVAIRLAERHRGTRTLIFHEQISAAQQIASGLEERHFNATIYHSGIGPVLRRDNLRLFRRGVFDCLVTCRALDEGVNVPETAVAVIASSTATVRQRIQRLGRVLRPSPGKQLATVYTIYASEVERRRLQREAENGTGAESIVWMRGTATSNG